MRVLSIATTHPRHAGDSEPAYVLEVNRGLASLGHRITTLLPHAPGARLEETVDGIEVRRFRYFLPPSRQRLCYNGGILPNLRRSWMAWINLPFFLAAQAAAVAREVRRLSPDLVHCHWLISSGLMGALAAGARNRPLVVSAHGSDVFLQNLLFQTANRFVLERARVCTVNSAGTRTRVHNIDANARTEIVPMGIHPSLYGPHLASVEVRRRMGGGQPQVLFIGRFSRHKGVGHLVRAMPEIARTHPQARLALIGFGPEEANIRRAVAEAGLEDRVRLVGPIPHSEVPVWLASADLVVLPSEKVEGLGVALLEALASGTPVVGSRVGGIPDVIRDGVTGLLCAPADPQDLAAKCTRLLGDEELRRRTTEEGRKLVTQAFSWERIASRFDDIFRELLEAQRLSDSSPGSGP
ncbi:MAG: glycosyltransferase family 4 protein [Acidobacteria bacterium]|nr:glycosyltransferase family 4 protein [Acidobacteriota bacterium]